MKIKQFCLGKWNANKGTTLSDVSAADLCSIPTLAQKRKLQIHPMKVTAVAWHPDAQHLVSMDQSGAAVLWDTVNGPVRQYMSRPMGTSVAVAPTDSVDQTTVAIGGVDNVISICNMSPELKKGEVTMTIPPDGSAHDGLVSAISFLDKMTLLSAGGDGELKIWNLSTGHAVSVLKGHEGDITGMAVADAGTNSPRVVSGSLDGTVRVWDVGSVARCIHSFDCDNTEVGAVCFFPNNQLVAAGCTDGGVRIFDLRAHITIAKLDATPHPGTCTGIGFSSSGRALYTAHEGGHIGIWEPFGARGAHTHGLAYSLYRLLWYHPAFCSIIPLLHAVFCAHVLQAMLDECTRSRWAPAAIT